MSTILSKLQSAKLLRIDTTNNVRHFSFSNTWIRNKKKFFIALGALTGGLSVFLYVLDQSVRASELEIHPPRLSWYHKGIYSSLDHASVRRGFEVYKNVCSACHSLRFVAFRDLVGVTHTEAEAKAIAEEYMVHDGPDEEGNMFDRPGKLSDYFPKPYPNEEAARAANNGASPPDLSYIIPARGGGEDYIFHLLTSYTEPPAGIALRETQHFNPYFMGGAISMAAPLYDDIIEYNDGTPTYTSQLAKDVACFLAWTCDPDFDERKRMLIRATITFPLLFIVMWYYKGHKWSSIKHRKVLMWPKKGAADNKQ